MKVNVRSESEIRADLARQLEDVVRNFDAQILADVEAEGREKAATYFRNWDLQGVRI